MVIIDKNKCIGCAACVQGCPVFAMKINRNDKAESNKNKCIGCRACLNCCPTMAIKEKKRY